MVIVVGGIPVLEVGLFDPTPGIVLLEADAGNSALHAVALTGEIAWFRGTGAVELTDMARRAEASGIAAGRVVLEPKPEPAEIEALVRDGFVVACAPDRFGFEPGGPLEAAVTAAVIHGAQLVRTVHARTARRCMDVALVLLAEREGDTAPAGADA